MTQFNSTLTTAAPRKTAEPFAVRLMKSLTAFGTRRDATTRPLTAQAQVSAPFDALPDATQRRIDAALQAQIEAMTESNPVLSRWENCERPAPRAARSSSQRRQAIATHLRRAR